MFEKFAIHADAAPEGVVENAYHEDEQAKQRAQLDRHSEVHLVVCGVEEPCRRDAQHPADHDKRPDRHWQPAVHRSDFWTATVIAGLVVLLELSTIASIKWRVMETPPLSAAAKVMLGGALVLAAGIAIGAG